MRGRMNTSKACTSAIYKRVMRRLRASEVPAFTRAKSFVFLRARGVTDAPFEI